MNADKPATGSASKMHQATEAPSDAEDQLPDTASHQRARDVLSPSLSAISVLSSYSNFSTWSIEDMAAVTMALEANFQAVKSGNTALAESMLFAQATALQAMFVSLARRAADQPQLAQSEAYLRMALKAQTQARATLESLYAIKNPPLVIARQANINNGGQQQVNNNIEPATPPSRSSHLARAERSANPPNELLDMPSHGKRLDRRTEGSTVSAHQKVGAVGEVHRPKNRRGKDPHSA